MERRKQERYLLNVPIRITQIDNNSTATFEASSRDISSKGVFIKTKDIKFESNQKVHLALTLTIEKLKELFDYPNTVTLEVDGSVVRSLQDGIVVAFGDSYSIVPAMSNG